MIRDLAYLDVEKATSLFSQIAGGLTTEIEAGRKRHGDERNIRRYRLPFLQTEFGGKESEASSRLERRILHHDLLRRLEAEIFTHDFAVDLNDALVGSEVSIESIRNITTDAYYLRVQGWPVLEDYQRIKEAVGEFNTIAEFIDRCNRHQFEQLEERLDEQLQEADEIEDRQQRNTVTNFLRTQKQMLNQAREDRERVGELDDWLVDGIQHWIETFMAGRINLRIFPFESSPEFQVIANLKRDSFVGCNVDDLLFAYGQEPNVKLTMTGLVTAQPPEDQEELFDTLQQYEEGSDRLDTVEETVGDMEEEEDDTVRRQEFEAAFRRVFTALSGLEDFSRFSRYPNVTLFPLAVYRSVEGETETQDGDEAPPRWKFWK